MGLDLNYRKRKRRAGGYILQGRQVHGQLLLAAASGGNRSPIGGNQPHLSQESFFYRGKRRRGKSGGGEVSISIVVKEKLSANFTDSVHLKKPYRRWLASCQS